MLASEAPRRGYATRQDPISVTQKLDSPMG
jgi:hypothetical protein